MEKTYIDCDGRVIDLSELDRDELHLVARLCRRAQTHPDWNSFDLYWLNGLAKFYEARGLAPSKIKKTMPFKIAMDLSNRLGLAAGFIRPRAQAGERDKETGVQQR